MSARPKVVTKAELDRIAVFLKAVGATVAAVEAGPGRVRIVTTEGRHLTLPDDDEILDEELEAHRTKHGYGRTQGAA